MTIDVYREVTVPLSNDTLNAGYFNKQDATFVLRRALDAFRLRNALPVPRPHTFEGPQKKKRTVTFP
ncbi:hypothetical protein BgiBS90_017156, partial [Biomphalaria glabrata]